MIESIPFEDGRILGFRVSGKVDVEDLMPVLGRLDALLEREEPLRAYVEFADLDGVSGEAILKDLQYLLKNFRALLKRFDKVAVVTDVPWIRGLSKLENLLIPGIEERVFAGADVVEAQAWISS